jgi:1,4-alpha-glucan branching enzyme
MPVTEQQIDATTPLGATLVRDGATFRVWAPRAVSVHVITDALPASRQRGWTPSAGDALVAQGDGTWAGFVAGLVDGAPYRFWVTGTARSGFKRDPYARELGTWPAFPDCDCLIRSPSTYSWHDHGFVPPRFRDLIIYQLHIGTFYGRDAAGNDSRAARGARFLDLLDRIEYLRDLGVNAVQPLPIQEFPTEVSMGYNGTDYFSPEMDYQVEDGAELARYLAQANELLRAHGESPITTDAIRPGPNQLKLVVDICHLYGIAVIFDVVYNHAGGGFDDQSIYFFDRQPFRTNNDSLYFTDREWAGGLGFAYWNAPVRRFLIDNACALLQEYHADGLRYDEVSVIDDFGGWSFCQELTTAVRQTKPSAIQIAEYWKTSRALAVLRPPSGIGCDAALADGLRDAVRRAVGQAAQGSSARVDMTGIADNLAPPPDFSAAWMAVQCVENHDVVYANRPSHEWRPRIAVLADATNARSWFARSRARVATALLLTAPGIPMLFMGQELLEDKNWSDNSRFSRSLVWWDGLEADRAMRDHLTFTRALIALRHTLPALSGDAINVFHVHDDNRVIAFHRWIDGVGADVVVVASLNERTFDRYELGFPVRGEWLERFNSDVFDNLPNPMAAGNGGRLVANGPPMHGFEGSARMVIPANGVLLFARG